MDEHIILASYLGAASFLGIVICSILAALFDENRGYANFDPECYKRGEDKVGEADDY